MTSPVAINFNNCTFNANQSTVVVSGGGMVDLSSGTIQLAGTFTFSTLNILNSQLQFDNNTGTGTVNGTLSIPVSPPGSGIAILTVNNFSGNASVTWGGTGYAVLASGDAVPLVGLT